VPFAAADSFPSLSWGDVGLAFVAFVGVTGYLPAMVAAIVQTGLSVIGKISGAGEK